MLGIAKGKANSFDEKAARDTDDVMRITSGRTIVRSPMVDTYAKDVLKQEPLRMVLSALAHCAIEKNRDQINGELEAVIDRELERRKGSSTELAATGRQGLTAWEGAETVAPRVSCPSRALHRPSATASRSRTIACAWGRRRFR